MLSIISCSNCGVYDKLKINAAAHWWHFGGSAIKPYYLRHFACIVVGLDLRWKGYMFLGYGLLK